MRADDGTSTAATLQVWLGAGPFIKKLIRYIQLCIPNLTFPPGGRFSNPTHFANADRCLLCKKCSKVYLQFIIVNGERTQALIVLVLQSLYVIKMNRLDQLLNNKDEF